MCVVDQVLNTSQELEYGAIYMGKSCDKCIICLLIFKSKLCEESSDDVF
jgi:hypothetical protein